MWFSGVVPIRVLAVFLAVFAAIFVLAPGARAQQVAGAQVAGYVTDPSGQAILGAHVNMIEIDKHTAHVATTDATGRYVLPNLPVGAYRLEVTTSGFKTYVQTGITLQLDINIEIPVTMQIGQVTETVQVAANAAMVETKENAISQLIGQQAIEELPLNGRNPTQLFILSGATSNMTLNGGDLTGSKNIQGSNASGQFSVAGAQANGINFLLDGGDNNDSFSNVNMPIPFPDAIQEFNVQFEGLPAQFGLHPGGTVNIATKSGTNELHGDLFDYFRNGDLNARPEGYGAPGFSVNTQQPRDSIKRNQFGGTVGGPVKKNKLFFFAGYQGTRQRSDPAQNTAYVPTAAALNGDFSVLDGAQSAGGCLKTARTLKDPSGHIYPNNRIPTTSFDAAGLKLASSYVPTATSPCGSYQFGYHSNNPDDNLIGRVDWTVSDKHSLFVRYYMYHFDAVNPFDGHNALTTASSSNQDVSQTATLGDNYTFTGTKVNSFHATFDRRRDNRASVMFSPQDLGVNMFINTPTYTQLSVSGYSGGGFNIGCGTCAAANFDVNTFQVADDFTWIKGQHQIAFGFDGRKQQFNSYNYQQANGQFTFAGNTTGDGLADLLIGRFSGLTDGNVISDYLRQTVIAAYVQDSFHVARNFTINYGVRYEPFLPTYDKYGRGNQFSFPLFQQGWHSSVYPTAPAGLIFSGDSAQDPYGNAFTASHKALFSPRLGMVWDPKGDGKQTVRAAFNLMHDTPEMFYPERWTTNSPYVSSLTLNSGQFSNPFAAYQLPNGSYGDPFPGNSVFPTGGVYVTVPPHLAVQYMMQWNVSYQRQVTNDMLLTVNYMGNATRHIWGSVDVNYALSSIPGATTGNTNNRRLTYLTNAANGKYYGDIQQTDDGANAEYHGLFLTMRKRFTHNFSSQANYTWSHCISSWDFAGELAGVVYQNPTNRATGERGNCGFDHRQTLNFSVTATSPGIGTSFAKALTKDWQLSPLVGFGSGNPIQLSDGGNKDISLSGQSVSGANVDRPEVMLPNQVYPSQKTRAEWFNPAAFQCAGSNAACTVFSGMFGNLGRNAMYGPGYINFDMALSRTIAFTERFRLNIRGDFFNVLNHANWNSPGTTVSTSSTFGVVSAFGSPRIIQMSAKVFF